MPETKLPPGSTIGILGGGQLGRMLAVAASRLGLKTHIYSDEPNAPAFDIAAQSAIGGYDDETSLAGFAANVDVITCEFENVPANALEVAGRAVPVFPSAKSFAVAQDRLAEKDFISALGVAVAPYAAVDSLGDLNKGLARVKTPALLKTRRFGYDGKGQVMIHTLCEAESAWEMIGEVPCVLEGVVRFEREVSVIAVRGQDGTVEFYDVVENVHQGGILATSRVPARISDSIVFEARNIAGKIAEALGHVGVLCVEMFEREGETPHLIVNEFAPRVHNSGHWTIDGCLISQFENHVRAICGWPLGDVARQSDAVMTNLIGPDVDDWSKLAAEPGTAVHLYGKAEARPGRKMGHVTRVFPKTSD
jgi:5-(carboxyamino)imidazole ribonucleotide synthase